MNEPKTIGEILTDYFLNSQEPFAVAFRNHFTASNQETNSCTVCPASPMERIIYVTCLIFLTKH